MKWTILAGAALLAAAAPATDWTRRVSQTPQGAFVLGNPAAKTRLVEYLSYTCDHCARFSTESSAALKARVAKGGMAVEVRNAVRDPIDLAAAMLARCTGPSRFFATHEKLLATQDQWMGAGVRYAQANQAALEAAKGPDRVKTLAKAAGLGPVVGLSDAQVDACLGDAAQQRPVMAMTQEAWSTRSIPGTPYFLINGQGAENVTSWAALEPRLQSK